MISFQKFLNLVDDNYYQGSFELRHGQTLMNILNMVWPEKYKEISGSAYDCFYDDGKVSILLDKLEKEWTT
jgi:hypothetical protein